MARALLLFVALLPLAGCGEPVPADAEIIARLNMDRAAFENVARLACETPALNRAEMKHGRLTIDDVPAPAEERSVEVARFMQMQQIGQISCWSGVTSFNVAAVGLGVSGQSKTLVHSPGGITENYEGGLVPDTDMAIAAHPRKSFLAYRELGGGWYIRNYS